MTTLKGEKNRWQTWKSLSRLCNWPQNPFLLIGNFTFKVASKSWLFLNDYLWNQVYVVKCIISLLKQCNLRNTQKLCISTSALKCHSHFRVPLTMSHLITWEPMMFEIMGNRSDTKFGSKSVKYILNLLDLDLIGTSIFRSYSYSMYIDLPWKIIYDTQKSSLLKVFRNLHLGKETLGSVVWNQQDLLLFMMMNHIGPHIRRSFWSMWGGL